jgi:hypothetical protein
MSFAKNDRNLRSNSGKTFPNGAEAPSFAAAIAEALKAEFGASPGAAKIVGRLTASNERAARNWLDGKNAPSAENLITLMARSDRVLHTVLRLADRAELAVAGDLSALRVLMGEVLRQLDDMAPGRSP